MLFIQIVRQIASLVLVLVENSGQTAENVVAFYSYDEKDEICSCCSITATPEEMDRASQMILEWSRIPANRNRPDLHPDVRFCLESALSAREELDGADPRLPARLSPKSAPAPEWAGEEWAAQYDDDPSVYAGTYSEE